ncbi:hypothetical protein H5P28_07900 [Ruficoccus amylovorans]|uniref:Cytosine permease n=1 Tax=Ruficoccus amylovorans TaxID=1804625 RepID=A0A842HCI7_9BACT|nr:hypothetical protein [Ruficoccus amylovorans]MBC2594183.1 hypothetical protein [Ruficoccus amylovorans]
MTPTTPHTPTAVPQGVPASEFEREPVPANKLKGANKFWGMYAGEHAAGTEFMIGPLFLLNGVSLQNIFLGLLVGNFLAVLSWRYVCAPIAARARLTLYYQLEKIAGGSLTKVYNLANGVLFCFLAGAMVTVSATAVGMPLNIPMPAATDMFPTSLSFVVIVLVVGLVIAVVASYGYETVARFANVASPWMILVFFACGVIALKELGVTNWSTLEQVWTESTIFAQNGSDQTRMGFWSVTFFAWFCNSAMNVGMADLSVFRFAKKPSYGWASSAGVYVGHYMAWIAAALMLAAQIKLNQDATPIPGRMASNVAGLAGIVCVIVAGWTTANPTIYRAGLAFQAMVPKASRFKVTLAAGMVATLAGVFPALAWKLLGFVGLYGTILAPVGAVIFVDWYFVRRQNPEALYNAEPASSFSLSVLAAWVIPVGIALYFMHFQGISSWFLPLPTWIACAVIYYLLSAKNRASRALPVA